MALVHISVFAVLSPADALLDAERIGLPAHMESPENRSCAAQHSHLFCQVVRSLLSATPAGRIALADLPAPSIFTAERRSGDDPAWSGTFLIGAINPRGPPLA